MTTATIRDLRNHFSKLSKRLAKGETIQIVSRGRPVARLVPESNTKALMGAARGMAVIPADFDEPMDLEWGSDDE